MEQALFDPIKNYFSELGYICDGEVKDIDLYMEKDGESVAVELKQTLDFRAVQQAALRQKLVDYVYIGTFMPKDLYSRAGKDKMYLLKRLGIGLIVVSKRSGNVNVVNEPIVTELASFKSRNTAKKKALSAEFNARRVKNNTGGVRGVKLVTAYRENALLVLDALMELGGEGKTAEIKEISGLETVTGILYRNPYGWFAPVSHGVYKVTEKGMDALEEFTDTIAKLKRQS